MILVSHSYRVRDTRIAPFRTWYRTLPTSYRTAERVMPTSRYFLNLLNRMRIHHQIEKLEIFIYLLVSLVRQSQTIINTTEIFLRNPERMLWILSTNISVERKPISVTFYLKPPTLPLWPRKRKQRISRRLPVRSAGKNLRGKNQKA